MQPTEKKETSTITPYDAWDELSMEIGSPVEDMRIVISSLSVMAALHESGCVIDEDTQMDIGILLRHAHATLSNFDLRVRDHMEACGQA